MGSIHFKFILSCFLIFNIGTSVAQQDFQGKAYYKSKTTVDMSRFGRPNMSEDQKKRFAERLKNMLEKSYTLSFNKSESIYKVEEKLEAPTQEQGGRGSRFRGMMSGAIDGNHYKNIKTKQSLTALELLGKPFLIKNELQKLEWTMSGETKQIGKYTCFKATAIKTWEDFDMNSLRRPNNRENDTTKVEKEIPQNIEIVAWYSMQIPVSHGPADFWGLPGLILEVNTENTTLLCSKIVLNPEEKFTIKQPSKGKEITKEAYTKLATKKFQEMRENFRRGGGRSGGGGGGRR